MKKLPIKAVIAAIFCNTLFGSAVPMIKLGYEFFGISDNLSSKLLYAGIRFFISGIIVLLISACMQKRFPLAQKQNWGNVILLGLTYTFLQYLFFYMGLSNTTGAVGSVISSASVFMSIFLAHFIYCDDKLNTKKIVGCVLGFAGVAIACLTVGGVNRISFLGEGFILLADVFFVLGSAINKRASKMDNSFTITAYNLLIGGFLLIVVGLIGYNGEITLNWQGALALAYLILVSSVGFTIWSILLRNYPMGKISVYNFVIPISGTLFSGLILRENVFTVRYFAALVMVSIGILIVNYHKNEPQPKDI